MEAGRRRLPPKDEDLRVALGEWQSTAELLRLTEQKAAEAERDRVALADQLEQTGRESFVADRPLSAAAEEGSVAGAEMSDESSQPEREHAAALEFVYELRRELMESRDALSASMDAIRSKDEEIGAALPARDTSGSLREALEKEMRDLQARLEIKLMAAFSRGSNNLGSTQQQQQGSS